MAQGKEGERGGGLLKVLPGFVEHPRNQERRQSGLGGGGDGGWVSAEGRALGIETSTLFQ